MRIISFILLLLLISCTEEISNQRKTELTEDRIPVQESWDSIFKITEDGLIKAIVYSDRTRKYNDVRETIMDTLKIDFYNDFGVKTTTLTSLYGRIDDQTKNMVAKKNVIAKNEDGVTLTTEELHWNNRTKKITTEEFVTITTSNEIIQGYGFESDQNLKNYEIFQPVIKADAEKKSVKK